MAYYTCSIFTDFVTIRVYGVSFGQQLRFFLRKSNTQALTGDVLLTASSDPFEHTFYNLESGTSYTVNVGLVSGGTVVDTYLGAQTFTTGGGIDPGPGPSNPRPQNWTWWSPIYSGGTINISANEWNAFCNRINEFRQYKGLSATYFSYVYSGMPISANIVNEARDAIYFMNYYVPYAVRSGDAISASFFLALQDALNNVN